MFPCVSAAVRCALITIQHKSKHNQESQPVRLYLYISKDTLLLSPYGCPCACVPCDCLACTPPAAGLV